MATLCDTCPEPGHCCRAFPLNFDAGPTPTRLDALVKMATAVYESPELDRIFIGLPFVPHSFNEPTREWRMDCLNLLPNGRCGDYANRPYGPCVMYQPKTDLLCVLHEPKEHTDAPP